MGKGSCGDSLTGDGERLTENGFFGDYFLGLQVIES